MKKETYSAIQQATAPAKGVWFVFTGRGMDFRGAFTSLDEAAVFVHNHVASGLYMTADLKHERDDEGTDLPLGSVTSLDWRCPMRKMTADEIKGCKSRFEKDWLKNPPNTSDFEQAKRQGVCFIAGEVEDVSITRGSRYAGYLLRAGQLNDVEKRAAEFVAEIAKLKL